MIRKLAKKLFHISTPNSDEDQLRLCPNPAMIFDVGANIGQTARSYRHLYPDAQIHSFEPIPATFDRLLKNTKGLNVNVSRLALDRAKGHAEMNIGAKDITNSLLHRATETGNTVSVETETIDAYCIANNITGIDILKIDVEGAEDRVLYGARGMLASGLIKMVFLEVYFNPVYDGMPNFGELDALLQQHGYRIYGLYSLVYSGVHHGRLSFGNALYVRT